MSHVLCLLRPKQMDQGSPEATRPETCSLHINRHRESPDALNIRHYYSTMRPVKGNPGVYNSLGPSDDVSETVLKPNHLNNHQSSIPSTMIAFIALSALLAVVAAEPPAVTGVYFVAPPPPPPSPPRVDLEKVTEDVMAQLKQLDGADSGSYHVYLPDGRLQQVTYTTAPLPADAASSAEQLSQYRHHRPSAPSTPFNFQNTQQVNHQFVTGSNQQNTQSNQKGRLVSADQPQPANYVASVSYTDVQPITGPIYAHSDQPLTRILRYAPTFV